jgi:hypothetical protein
VNTEELRVPLLIEIPDEYLHDGMWVRAMRPKRARLRYSATDPYAVVLEIAEGWYDPLASPDLPAVWTVWDFARGLLAEGLHSPSGSGDVRVWPDTDTDCRVWIELSSPSGRLGFALPRAAVEDALESSYELVPAGTESARIDWERELAALAAGGGGV